MAHNGGAGYGIHMRLRQVYPIALACYQRIIAAEKLMPGGESEHCTGIRKKGAHLRILRFKGEGDHAPAPGKIQMSRQYGTQDIGIGIVRVSRIYGCILIQCIRAAEASAVTFHPMPVLIRILVIDPVSC